MWGQGGRPSSERDPKDRACVRARVYMAYTCRVVMLATGNVRLACLFLGARVVLDFGTFSIQVCMVQFHLLEG